MAEQPASSTNKQLSFAAIVVIAANTMNGPGLTTLPSIASSSGQVTFSVLVLVAALATSFVVHRLVSVMWNVHQHISLPPPTTPTPCEDLGDLGDHHDDDNQLEKLLTDKNDAVASMHTRTSTSTRTSSRPRLEETDIVALTGKLFNQKKKKKKKLASLVMVGCALSLALAQMMLCAAIADSMFVASLGKTCGVAPFQIYCTSNLSMKPFQTTTTTTTTTQQQQQQQAENDSHNRMTMTMTTTIPPVSLISAGLVVASSITMCLAAVDLDSLLVAQYVLFGCLLVACARFCSTLWDMTGASTTTPEGITGIVPVVFDDDDDLSSTILLSTTAPYWIGPRPFDAVGPILFNFAFVVTAPPLICGTNSPVRGSKALVVACLLMGALYMLVGRAGANAATNTQLGLDDNLLSLVLRGRNPELLDPWDILAVSLFGMSQLAAIPVYCELARETLTTHLQVSSAFLLSHASPWIVVALTYNSALFEAFVEWSSLILLGFANFSVPLLLDHAYTQRLIHAERDKLHAAGSGTCASQVLWGLALITAAIAAVIVQRLTESLVFAEVVFIGTLVSVFEFDYR